MIMKNKKQLEIKMQQIPPHPNPKVSLEQYSTPSQIASDILWNAYTLGDVLDKNILDLGCGCGTFAIGSLLLGAKSAIGVDIDENPLKIADEYADKFKVDNYKFIKDDVRQFKTDGDINTIFQNPPFGSQKYATRGIDLEFIKSGIGFMPDVIYSFHMASTRDFLIDYYSGLDLEITHIFNYNFKIPKIYEFHTKEFKNIEVIVFRAINS